MYTTCSRAHNFHVMNNLLSYCGLVDAKIRASDKNLPVALSWKVLYNLKTIDVSKILKVQTHVLIGN